MKTLFKISFCFALITLFSCKTQQITLEQQVSGIDVNTLYPSPSIVIEKHNEWTKNHYAERVAHFRKNPLEIGDVVFLGNSITEGGKDWSRFFNRDNVKNRGIGGDITEGVINRIDEICYYKPEAVFILIGINDLFNGTITNEEIVSNILKMVRLLNENSPGSRVYVQTVLPTANTGMVPRITDVNKRLTAEIKSARYRIINLHSLFADEADLMKDEYTYDGTHLNAEGYEVWTNYVKQYVETD